MSKKIACVGDVSSHGGYISTSGQDGKLTTNGEVVAVKGAMHVCPLEGHGTTAINNTNTSTTSYDGNLIVVEGATAGCGAAIQPTDRGIFIE